MKYKYKNLEPLGRHLKDCVCRAISNVTNERYETIERKLYLIGELYECEQLCVACYYNLLENYYNYTRVKGVRGMKIRDFANTHPYGNYIIRIDGHLTALKNGILEDIWDCSEETIDIVWEEPIAN